MRSSRRGFTLLEVVIVAGIIGISASVAALTFGNLQRSERRREIIRSIVGISALSRAAAQQLGPSARTPRAQLDATCTANGLATIFSQTNNALNARAGIVFLPNVTCSGGTINCCPAGQPTPCDLVIWSDRVRRVASAAVPWNGDNFVMSCAAHALGERDGSMIDTGYTNNLLTTGVGGTLAYYAFFDERGFVASPTPARLGIAAKVGGATLRKGVVLLASGVACLEGNNLECARMP